VGLYGQKGQKGQVKSANNNISRARVYT